MNEFTYSNIHGYCFINHNNSDTYELTKTEKCGQFLKNLKKFEHKK